MGNLPEAIEAFIAKWKASSGAERANYARFLEHLCDILGVDRPDVSIGGIAGDYAFERPVRPRESAEITNPKRIDLYKKGCFILEAKQSRLPNQKNAIPGQDDLFKEDDAQRGLRSAQRGWDVMMQNARRQAEGYVFLLEPDQPAPPFVIACDVGHCLELYADFSGTGRAYTQFPDRNRFRIFLEDLRDAKIRDLLAKVWTDAASLDPAKNAVRVTREIARRLAQVSKALEERGNNPEDVAHFLMRCLFTMFAEDVNLLPRKSFENLLMKCVDDPSHFPHRVKQLWADMEKGAEFSHVIEARVLHFNGGLFKNTTAFELRKEEIGELLAAAKADWQEVDPAIFGTLLEQALDPVERRKLGAHYTPRAYVQRLVEVTVMEPLRADWEAALTKAEAAKEEGKDRDAIKYVRAFHDQLTHTRVLDPACGTGNFLYVALELMKQLEGEVLETLTKLGDEQGLLTLKNLTVDPHLFLGLELNPRAAAIAELVVWIGYLQWHYRNTTGHPQEPILRAFENINFGKRDGYDAVLTWDGYPVPGVETYRRLPAGNDGGRQDAGGTRVETYPNARRPAWPEAEFIVGNPPFSGVRLMRSTLGSEYVDALRATYPEVPETSDYVLYWWHRAAMATRNAVRRFGLICTNSITQPYSRVLLRSHQRDNVAPIEIIFAIADHPWVDSADGADVRVSMTVAEQRSVRREFAVLGTVVSESETEAKVDYQFVAAISDSLHEERGINDAVALRSNESVCFQGVVPAGEGFKLSPSEADHFRGLGEGDLLKAYSIGRDLTQIAKARFIIDAFGLTEMELRKNYPHTFALLVEKVQPERRQNRRATYRDNWWIFAEPRPAMREALADLARFIGTPNTSKHRLFTFVSGRTLPDAMVYAVTLADAAFLALLSSRFHHVWSVETGSRMGVGNDYRYTKTRTFDPFPFPDPPEPLKAKLRALGEELDATRKRVQAEHPDLTLTGLYNVLEKVMAGAVLSEAEGDVKTRGRVLVLKDLHDQIDAATAEAYGWPADLSDEQILERLVALNAERAKEEAQGFVRWLRPDYQIPRFAKAREQAGELALERAEAGEGAGGPKLPAFPTDRHEQPLAVEAALAAHAQQVDAAALTRLFKGKATSQRQQRIAQVLTTLARYGRVIALDGGRYAARRAA